MPSQRPTRAATAGLRSREVNVSGRRRCEARRHARGLGQDGGPAVAEPVDARRRRSRPRRRRGAMSSTPRVAQRNGRLRGSLRLERGPAAHDGRSRARRARRRPGRRAPAARAPAAAAGPGRRRCRCCRRRAARCASGPRRAGGRRRRAAAPGRRARRVIATAVGDDVDAEREVAARRRGPRSAGPARSRCRGSGRRRARPARGRSRRRSGSRGAPGGPSARRRARRRRVGAPSSALAKTSLKDCSIIGAPPPGAARQACGEAGRRGEPRRRGRRRRRCRRRSARRACADPGAGPLEGGAGCRRRWCPSTSAPAPGVVRRRRRGGRAPTSRRRSAGASTASWSASRVGDRRAAPRR